ncbi:MAG: chemotaxis protein CheC [Elusimicrobiaceae bacterium]|nr:chemotaxis protein CheC [Elusimicrobiaceae bacterium]
MPDCDVNYDFINYRKIDLLREIGTIGSGRAATAFGRMIRHQIGLAVPEVRLYPPEKLRDILRHHGSYYVLEADTKGDITGRQFLLVPSEEAEKLGRIILTQFAGISEHNLEMFRSALVETANILLSSYANAVSMVTGFTAIVGVPRLHEAETVGCCDVILAKTDAAFIYVQSVLIAKQLSAEFYLFFVPDQASLIKIFDKLAPDT